MERPLHPGDAVRLVLRKCSISADDLIRAGCDARWVNDVLRRYDELPTQGGRYASTMDALVAATGIRYPVWKRIQNAWDRYCRSRSHQFYHSNDAEKRRIAKTEAEERWKQITG